MGQNDWKELQGTITRASLARGVTAAVPGPNGGNGFVYAYNSLDGTVSGAHGWIIDLNGFCPTGTGPAVADGGVSIRGCLKRVSSPNNTGMSPALLACIQGGADPTVNDIAYMIGLSDNSPYSIVLAKGQIVGGLRSGATNVSILRSSAAQYNMSDSLWHHLRLDAVVEPNGDVLLKCYANDLALHPINTTPSWQAIPGMSDYIDDVNHINSGSAPLWGGCCGYAFSVHQALNRRGAFDGIQALRQQ